MHGRLDFRVFGTFPKASLPVEQSLACPSVRRVPLGQCVDDRVDLDETLLTVLFLHGLVGVTGVHGSKGIESILHLANLFTHAFPDWCIHLWVRMNAFVDLVVEFLTVFRGTNGKSGVDILI